jgi:hypothetical protein
MAKPTKQKFESAGPSVPVTLPAIHVAARPFTYTSPSAVPPRSAEARRERGCEEETYKTKKGPKVKFTGRLKNGKPDTFCKPTSKPCGERSSCPVQLVWLNGTPHLRFCNALGQPGHVVEVQNAREAQALAAEACADWPNPKKRVKWPAKYFEKKAPGVIERSRRGRPNSPWGAPGLGAAGERILGPGPASEAMPYQPPPTFGSVVLAAAPFAVVGAIAAWLATPPKPPAPAAP